MLATVVGVDALIILLWLASLALVIWAIVDVARRPTLTPGAKAGWIISLVVGTFLFGVVGLIIAIVYLAGVRPRLVRGG